MEDLILAKASKYRKDMVNFLQDLVQIPSPGGQEKKAIKRIEEEMIALGFPEVKIDAMGNVIGRIGYGKKVIAFDGHVDHVDVGDLDSWKHHPFQGNLIDDKIYGRGTADQKGGLASMLYAGKIIKELDLYEDFSLYFVGSVQEESYEGVSWQHIMDEEDVSPHLAVITEPSNLTIKRGHRGRLEIKVIAEGVSAHGSTPDQGENAVYKILPVAGKIPALNENLEEDEFLGKGSIALTCLECDTFSPNTIPHRATITLDRRLTLGETKEEAKQQVENLVKESGASARVEISRSTVTNYTGLGIEVENYYPAWVLKRDHPYLEGAIRTYKKLFNSDPQVDKWLFSTNATYIAGIKDIPCIGFGPGNDALAHTVDEYIPVEHLIKAAAFYAAIPLGWQGK